MIKVQNLTKIYGSNVAVNGISFTVEKGKIYGFLGPNGAGKSTTMNIVTGCLAATEGKVLIDGHDIYEEPIQAKKLIGYLPEVPPLYPEMTVYEYLMFIAGAKKVPSIDRNDKVTSLMEQIGLASVCDRLIGNLSKGYRQRVGIAQAMLGDPEIIILDEPTVGLDPRQVIEVRELIASLAKEHTVIISSHILSEIQQMCDNVIIISNGRIVANGTLASLTENASGYNTVVMKIKGAPDAAFGIIDAMEEISHFEITEDDDGNTDAVLTVPAQYDVRETLFKSFAENGVPVLEMYAKRPSLEEIYMRLTESVPTREEASAEEDDGGYEPIFAKEEE